MADRDNRDDWRRERSLLALGQAMRGDDARQAPLSLVPAAEQTKPSWQDDAAARHRLARSRREAKPNPLLSALAEAELPSPAENPAPDRQDQQPAATGDRHGGSLLKGLLPGWLKPNHSETPPPVPPDASFRAAEAPAPSILVTAETAPPVGYAGLAPTYETATAWRDHPEQWKPLIDPMKVIGGVAKSKLLIAATTILGAGLGVAIALSTPKKYEATTELIVDPRDLKLTDRNLTQDVVASDATLAIVENQVRVLTSGTVLNKVVDKLNLVNDPEFNGQGTGGLGVMSLIRSVLSRDDGPGAIDEGRRRALAVGNLAEKLSVERGGKTFVITVSAITQNGEKSALIANTMTDVFLQTFGQIQSDTAGRATDELTARLEELRKGVEAAERKVEDFRAAHDLVDAQGHLISDDELLKLNEQLSIARARTLELNARAASARALNVDSVLGGTLPEEINSGTMGELRSQYAALKQADDSAAVRLGPRHPERLALDAQLAGARDRIATELRRIASSLQVDLKRAVQLEQELASRLAQLKVRSGDVNNDLVTLRELEREANAKRAVYEAYLLRAKETGEQRDINTANINVISKAFAPLEPNGPSRAIVALAGLLLGFASGVGLGAMRGAYESVRDSADSRSRRRGLDRGPAFVEAAIARPPAPAPEPVPAAAATAATPDRARPIDALLQAVRKAMPHKSPTTPATTETPSDDPDAPAVTEAAKPTEKTMYNVQPDQTASIPQHPGQAGYPQPPQQAAYAQQAYPQYPFQHGPQPQMMPQHPMYPAPQNMQPQPYPPVAAYPLPYPYPQPHPYAQQPMGYPQQPVWQAAPVYPFSQPGMHPAQMAPYYPVQPAPKQQAAAQQPSAEARQPAAQAEPSPIEEIRASLREFREAVRDLTENRTRRRYF